MTRTNRFRLLQPLAPLFLALFLLAPTAAQGQSVEAVINEMKARYEQQFASVDNYIIETDKYTTYFRKADASAEARYESRTVWNESEGLFGQMDFSDSPGYYATEDQLDKLAAEAEYGGTETIDGTEAHVLLIDDPQALADDGSGEENPEEVTGTMRLYIDASQYVPIRMDFEAQVESERGTQTVKPTMTFSDYRTIDGLTVPWMMQMKMDNLNSSMSPEERAQARESLEQMEEQMKNMSDRQRKMMERMLKGKMESLRKIIEEGTIEFNVQVRDVKVNTGIPDDVFTSSN